MRKSRSKEWKPLTLQELKNFVAPTILMGLDEKPDHISQWLYVLQDHQSAIIGLNEESSTAIFTVP